MKKIITIVAFAMMYTACATFNLGESTEKARSNVTIALDRIVDSHASAQKSTMESSTEQVSGQQGSDAVDRQVIYRAQTELTRLGYNPGPIDGIWGPRTQRAAKKFQQDSRLPVTGILDDDTRRQLMNVEESAPKDAVGAADHPPAYSLMPAEEARQLIERHIREKDIYLETNLRYRKRPEKSDSAGAIDIFQGVKFDNENYLVFALCEPGYRMVKPSDDLSDKLAKQEIDIPDNGLSFTFNGLFYSTVDLEVKAIPVFSYTDQGAFVNTGTIPGGGYQWLIGDFGMNLGNTFIFFPNPLKKSFVESLNSRPAEFIIKMSLPKEQGILLDIYRP